MLKKIFLLLMALWFVSGCGAIDSLTGAEKEPEEITLPGNPLERAAVQGLITSYKESTMWQIQKVEVKSATPMAPTGVLIELQDPKEVYCVCLEYEARYKVNWTTSQGSPWEKTVRNILVIKTQGDQYLPVRPMNICPAFCN
ncbi:MAG: hypothetical protein LBF58_06220 [Deltaproteobacteria bacterium]|jgi:hypothetical protein|nr:hypothetical protein [Deltaproteobacteria bacterium]